MDMESGDGSVEPEVYQQELKRTLGSFQVFAISFAFISVAVGIFGTYDVVLQRGGPVGIWLWVLVAVGQVLVALVYAQFAARIPLSGSSYQWASRLASPKIGLGFGWLTACYLAIAVVAVDNALAETAFMPLFGIQPDEHTARLGLVFVITVTIAIDSIPKVTDSDSPIAAIIRDQLGSAAERVFLTGITLAFFGAGTAVMTACSRLVFAMSRDSRFPAHRVMRRVNPRTHTPIPATLMIFIVGVVLMVALPGGALLKLIVASTILPAIIYCSTIVLYLVVRKQLGRKEGAFNLGRLELPVAIGALVWVVCALFVLTVPGESLIPDLIVVGLVAAGGLFFLSLLIFHPETLKAEPWFRASSSSSREGRG